MSECMGWMVGWLDGRRDGVDGKDCYERREWLAGGDNFLEWERLKISNRKRNLYEKGVDGMTDRRRGLVGTNVWIYGEP